MGGHHIEWTFDQNSVTSRVVCDEPLGADCRLAPIKGSVLCDCESWTRPLRDEHGPYHVYDGELGDEKHRMEDMGECNIALYLDDLDFGVEEFAANETSFEIGRTAIEPVWAGDYYEWKPVTP